MKNPKLLIAAISGALLLAIILNIRSINGALSDVMLSITERIIYKAPLISFSCETVDSLYNDKAYKYMLFVRDLPIENEASLSALEDSILIVRNNKALDWNISLASDTIALPESLFNYAIVGEENAALYAIESVEQDSPNRYKMRKVRWPKVQDNTVNTLTLSEKKDSEAFFKSFLKLESVVPIETNDSCLINTMRRVLFYGEKAFILNGYKEVLIINNQTGAYLGRIRRLGGGPGEYVQIMDIAICEDQNQIIVYSDRMKLIFYDMDLNYIREQDVNDELYEHITCSNGLFYFYNPLGTSNKNMIAIYDIEKKEWKEETGGVTSNFNIKLEGVSLAKSKSIWYTTPLESSLSCIRDSSALIKYNLLIERFGAKDKLLSLEKDPSAFFGYIYGEKIHYALNSVKETSKSIFCKSNIYPLIIIHKESNKANYIEDLFDPCFGASKLKYVAHDSDTDMVMLTLSAEDWVRYKDQFSIPVEIRDRIPNREIGNESNSILLFYRER